MILLFDIGNTNTHVGLATTSRVIRHTELPTADWFAGTAGRKVKRFAGRARPRGAAICSVVPQVTPLVHSFVDVQWGLWPVELTHQNLAGVQVDYPRPETIGPDRLANAVAARHFHGAPVVVIDFGTAVTFDVVDRRGAYVGGIIAPGLSAMTDYLHERTALLPRIRIRDIKSVIGRNTEEAMLIGAVHGYRGLIHRLAVELKAELRARRLPLVATGGYAELISAGLPEITTVNPTLTLEGIRLVWLGSGNNTGGATE